MSWPIQEGQIIGLGLVNGDGFSCFIHDALFNLSVADIVAHTDKIKEAMSIYAAQFPVKDGYLVVMYADPEGNEFMVNHISVAQSPPFKTVT